MNDQVSKDHLLTRMVELWQPEKKINTFCLAGQNPTG